MKITYDKKIDAMNIVFKAGRVNRTLEIAPEILLDLDKAGNPISLEVLDASEKLGQKTTREFLLQNLAVTKK